MPDPHLTIVANRLPVHRVGHGESARWQASPGGLVTALSSLFQRDSAWVGWTGSTASVRAFVHKSIRIKTVSLSSHEIETYYHGFSNRTLWPLYHDAIRSPEFNREWWRPYTEVNRRFARAAAGVAPERSTIWVHDYHLQLVPRFLRELRPDLKIGFFLHIPFPPEELFAWLPWRADILEGLLGADLVGFQTASDARNFSRAARAYTSAEGTDTVLEVGARQVRVGSFPISIDFKSFDEAAASRTATRQMAEIRRRIGQTRRIMLCVDRLDYTKGIENRLQAFEEMLRRRRVSLDECVLVQIAVPSRETVVEYAETRNRIEQIVGRINGEYSAPGRIAVHYFRRGFSRAELAAYYRAADVMLVTPLRDGMNLVAKEYVASRVDSSGVLVLSEFAGAARELRRALLVNPRDIDQMSERFEQALRLSAAEARQRMAILRMVVRRHDVHDWANSFLTALLEM
jgi:trehalose 6-phosphate synthase